MTTRDWQVGLLHQARSAWSWCRWSAAVLSTPSADVRQAACCSVIGRIPPLLHKGELIYITDTRSGYLGPVSAAHVHAELKLRAQTMSFYRTSPVCSLLSSYF